MGWNYKLQINSMRMILMLIVLSLPQQVLQYEDRASFQLLLPFNEVSRSRSLYGYPLDSMEVRKAVKDEPWKILLTQEEGDDPRSSSSSRPTRIKLPRESIVHLLMSKNNEKLGSLLKFDRSISSQSVSLRGVEGLAERVLDVDRCYSSDVLLKLGLELEEKFPSSSARMLAEQIYAKSLACSQDEFALVSGYRLALMLIWRNNFEEALRLFDSIQRFSDGGALALRIRFWQAYCARMINDVPKQMGFEAWILKKFPLSLYAHTVSLPTVKGDYLDFDRNDSLEVAFRPSNHLPLASLTRKIELLLLSGDQDSAAHLLVDYTPFIQNERDEFRLYWSILLDRSGKRLQAYQSLLDVIRGDTRRFTKPVLEFLYPRDYLELIQDTSPEIDPFLILSLIRQESVFNQQAMSSAKAYGLMQLQVPTARVFQRKLSHHDLYDPRLNIRIGVRYLKQLIQDHEGSIEMALAAYNAGPARLKKWRHRYPINHPLLFLDLIPVKETREYVSSILRNYYFYRSLYPQDYERIQNRASFSSVQFN